jgi:hypothetical protein
MATQIPHIEIQHPTPITPSANLVREVYLPASHAQGLEVDPNGRYPEPSTDAHYTKFAEKELRYDDNAGLILSKELDVNAQQRRERRICGCTRRTFIIVASVVSIIVICAAIGGGVGGYYAHKSSTPSLTPSPSLPSSYVFYPLAQTYKLSPVTHLSPSTSLPASFTSEPTSPPAIPTSTPSPAPVTSGTVGMAALPCTENVPSIPVGDHPYRTTGATFRISCQLGLPRTGAIAGDNIANFKMWVTYNITDCMDKCAGVVGCKGVVSCSFASSPLRWSHAVCCGVLWC